MTFYNEFDPKAAAWLRELIREGHIPPGHVDERSICDIRPDELTGFAQQHFFAGIGGWAFALRLAGWPDDRPVRTGSCPCQPFSSAGKKLGTKDERHLWPVFRDLITFGESTITFGEQVAKKAGREWLAGVRADLEGLGYAVGGADLCSAGVGAPHIRQRIHWMAYRDSKRRAQRKKPDSFTLESEQQASRRNDVVRCGIDGRLADANGGLAGDGGLQCGGRLLQQPQNEIIGGMADAQLSTQERLGSHSGEGLPVKEAAGFGEGRALGDTVPARLQERSESEGRGAVGDKGPSLGAASPLDGSFWGNFDLIGCTDGKMRRIESGSFPLAHGVSGRVGLLRGYGNAINPWLAKVFIEACQEALT